MAVEKVVEKHTVKMKFTGNMKENEKVIDLPIPFISNSQKVGQLVFKRPAGSRGPLTCDLPLKWVGELLVVGGNWKLNEDMTDELSAKIEKAKKACEKEMEAFVLENEMVEA